MTEALTAENNIPTRRESLGLPRLPELSSLLPDYAITITITVLKVVDPYATVTQPNLILNYLMLKTLNTLIQRPTVLLQAIFNILPRSPISNLDRFPYFNCEK